MFSPSASPYSFGGELEYYRISCLAHGGARLKLGDDSAGVQLHHLLLQKTGPLEGEPKRSDQLAAVISRCSGSFGPSPDKRGSASWMISPAIRDGTVKTAIAARAMTRRFFIVRLLVEKNDALNASNFD
jgi:hypothetical protein